MNSNSIVVTRNKKQKDKSMKRYIGTKVIKAEPKRAWKQFGVHPAGTDGYAVKYEDGYESWSPKSVFEDAYVEITNPVDTDILRFFAFDHLPERLQKISKPFCLLANVIHSTLPLNAERTAALRKLLESKDAAVRANIH